MSNINTTNINVNYPSSRINNNSSGFRSNYVAIKSALDTAKTEITELQNKALLKSPLIGKSTTDNDLNGNLLTNATVKGFHQQVYNLGEILIGNVTIDVTNGDVQQGTATSDIRLGFTNWGNIATHGYYYEIRVLLKIPTKNTKIYFPESVYDENEPQWVQSGMRTSVYKLRNINNLTSVLPDGTLYWPDSEIDMFDNQYQTEETVNGTAVINHFLTTPIDNYEITLIFSSYDNGETFDVESLSYSASSTFTDLNYINQNLTLLHGGTIVDLPAESTIGGLSISSIADVAPTSETGSVGDSAGKLFIDSTYLYVCIGDYDGTTVIWKKALLTTF